MPSPFPSQGKPLTDSKKVKETVGLNQLWVFIKPYRGRMLMAFVVLVIAAGAALAVPLSIKQIVDHGFLANRQPEANLYFLIILATVTVMAVFSSLRYYLVMWLGERIIADIRMALYRHVLDMDPLFYETTPTGEVLSRLTADTTLVQAVVGAGLSMALRNSIQLIGCAVMLALTSLQLTGLVVLAIPLMLGPALIYGRRVRHLSKQNEEPPALRLAGLTGPALENARKLLVEIQQLRRQIAALTRVTASAYVGTFAQPPATHRLYRGDPLAPREPVAPDTVAVIGKLALSAEAPEAARRKALAEWIVAPDNPLAARVIANRLWQHHFGNGLVATPSDFGRMGIPPTHPELLDYLAAELGDGGWSLKSLHRLILTSATYQQSSRPNPAALKIDAGSRLLWRFPPRRLEAEAIRDNVLAASGSLDFAMYGPGYSVFEPNDNYVRVYTPRTAWGPADWRRMIYMTKVRMENDPVFGNFDCPDAGLPAPARARSTTAIQSLNLLNSTFIQQQSNLLAARIEREIPTPGDDRPRRAFILTLGRSPDADELAAATSHLRDHSLPSLCRVLLNTNEFLFLP